MAQVHFLIVTALEEERDSVLSKLPNYQQLRPSTEDVRTYYSAEVPTRFADDTTGMYKVIVVMLLGMGRVEAANATSDAIRRWQPQYVMMVGIAGGISDNGVNLGDILVSNQVVDYELQKLTPEGAEVRYSVHLVDPRLQGAAQSLRPELWQPLVQEERPVAGTPKRIIGPIATGDKVIAFNTVLDKYRSDWPNLIGVEMEAGGVSSAAFQSATPPGFFMVRGVSDLADNHKDAPSVLGWRKYACDIGATYAIALIQNGPIAIDRQSYQRNIDGTIASEATDVANVPPLLPSIPHPQPGRLSKLRGWPLLFLTAATLIIGMSVLIITRSRLPSSNKLLTISGMIAAKEWKDPDPPVDCEKDSGGERYQTVRSFAWNKTFPRTEGGRTLHIDLMAHGDEEIINAQCLNSGGHDAGGPQDQRRRHWQLLMRLPADTGTADLVICLGLHAANANISTDNITATFQIDEAYIP